MTWRRMVPWLAVAVLLTGAGWIAWHWRRSAARTTISAQNDIPASVIVPPFRSADGSIPARFGGDLAADVEHALSARRGLTVRPWNQRLGLDFSRRSPTSGDDASDLTVSRRLHAAYVLVGHMARDSARIVIAVRLLRTRDGNPVWSGTYWRDPDAMQALASELALAVAEVLHAPP